MAPVLAAVVLVQACTTSTVTGVDVGSIAVDPSSATLLEGQEIPFRAMVRDDEGNVVSGAEVSWSTGAPDIATIGSDGRVRALRAGTTTVQASFQGVQGSADVTVLPGPALAVAPAAVEIFGTVGGSPPAPAAVAVTNGGAGTLEGLAAAVEYESGSGWLSPGLNSTRAPALLSLVTAPGALSEGVYRATVVLSAAATLNSPVRIPVVLTMTRGGPILRMTPSALALEAPAGTSTPGFASIRVSNEGGGSIGGLSTTTGYGPGEPTGWLSASLAGTGVPTDVLVRVDVGALAEGTYTGEVRVASPDAVNSPLALPVTLTVSADVPGWAGFTLTESDGTTEVGEDGSTDDLTVTLDARPTVDVVLAVTTSDAGEAVAEPATLLFTPDDWATPRVVVVTGVDDPDPDGPQTTTLTVSVIDERSDDAFDPFPDRTVAVVTRDDDNPPDASITGPVARSFTQGATIAFTGTATDPEDGSLSGASLVWTSSLQNPSRIGTGTSFGRSDLVVGTHQIVLTATDSDGHTGTDRITLTVSPPAQNPPSASFTVSCTGLECAFTDTSTDADGSVVSWSWDFGDGSSSSDRNPTHRFAATGTYTVRLTATDDDGATGTATRTVALSGRPTASFTTSCSGLGCAFTDTSTDADGSVVAWSWDFGDGRSSTQRNPSHTYATGDDYTVTLTVTDDDGQTSLPATRVVTTNAPPTAAFVVACTDLSCSFLDLSTDSDGTVVGWSWDFGDGKSSSTKNPGHSYSAGGTYTVRLVVTDDDGTESSPATLQITVTSAPRAGFDFTCSGLACSFTDTSVDPGGSVEKWAWDFGDGKTSPKQNPDHTYARGGDYAVTLTVTDDDGLTDQQTRTVSVTEPPSAVFTFHCKDLECEFRDRSTDPDGSVVAWSWSFGDGASSTKRSPKHTYPRGGDYTVTLTVTDDDGASDQTSQTVSVNGPPSASFTWDCAGLTCTFTDTSTDPGGFINLRTWDFGDGGTGTGAVINHTFRAPGDYAVELTVIDNDGKKDEETNTVTVGGS